jgi:hypothetical protein
MHQGIIETNPEKAKKLYGTWAVSRARIIAQENKFTSVLTGKSLIVVW